MTMSTRLQILVSEDEAKRLRQCARREGLTLSEWVRRALQRAEQRQSGPTPEQKARAIDRALTCNHPTGEIDKMLAEIEQGRDLR
jgi:DNA polymerase III delta prime subunit